MIEFQSYGIFLYIIVPILSPLLTVIQAQAESTVHMLNWAIRSVKFLGVEFD